MFGVVFFAATQTISGRDVWVLLIGLLIGAAAAASLVFGIFHQRMAAIPKPPDPIALKKAEVIGTLPTRRERLKEVTDRLRQLRIEVEAAQGSVKANQANAQEAMNQRMRATAEELLANAKTWMIAVEGYLAEMQEIVEEAERLEAMTDEDYLAELKRLKGLD